MPSACSPFSLACLSLARVVVRSCPRLFAHVAGRSPASLFAHVAGRSSFTRSRRCLLALPFSCVAIRSRRRTHRTPTHPVAHHHRSHVDWSCCLRCLRCLSVPLGTKNSRVFVVATSWLYGFGRVCIEVRLHCFSGHVLLAIFTRLFGFAGCGAGVGMHNAIRPKNLKPAAP